MKKWFCDICGEEITENEKIMSFRIELGDDIIQIDSHHGCYMSLVNRIKRCVEGEKITRPQRV